MFDVLLKRPENKNQESQSGQTYNMVGDRKLKSAVKAVSWRIVGTLDTMIISYILTGKLHVALSIGSVEVFTKMILYYFHERAWNSVRWGRVMVRLRRNGMVSRKSSRRKVISLPQKQAANA